MTLTERNLVLVVHIVAAIVFLGPVTVAISLFPRYALQGEWQVARAMYRISRSYGMLTLVVPAVGLYLASRMDYLGFLWINLSLALFAAALVLLVGYIVPEQAKVLKRGGSLERRSVAMLRAASGSFGTIWLVILYLMVAKPN